MGPADLYRDDFLAWTEKQAEALRSAKRSGANLPLDWENLAEEVESLGTSQRLALGSEIRRILRHLLKLEHSPAIDPRNGWKRTVRSARAEIEALLRNSLSLRREMARLITEETESARSLAADDLEDRGELDAQVAASLHGAIFAEDQVLGDWFPEEPSPKK